MQAIIGPTNAPNSRRRPVQTEHDFVPHKCTGEVVASRGKVSTFRIRPFLSRPRCGKNQHHTAAGWLIERGAPGRGRKAMHRLVQIERWWHTKLSTRSYRLHNIGVRFCEVCRFRVERSRAKIDDWRWVLFYESRDFGEVEIEKCFISGRYRPWRRGTFTIAQIVWEQF